MRAGGTVAVVLSLVCGCGVSRAYAQPPAAVPSPWTQTASAGLALTSGNKDTSTINLGYEVVYDPKTRNRVKSDGLFLRGKTEGTLTTDRLALNGRDEVRLSERAFSFVQVQYLGDQFKNIDYLVSPSVGLGVRLQDTPRTKLAIDLGLGEVWEKPLESGVKRSGAVTVGEKASRQLSPSATVGQSFTALYKTNDLADALYTFGANIAASVTQRVQLKVELLDTYKNAATAPVQKNDVALIVGMVFKR